MPQLVLSPCRAEPELLDPAVTGAFAADMAELAQMEHRPPWCGYVARAAGVPVGFGTFKGPPDEAGAVEIGYLTFPAHAGRGVAQAVAEALCAIARGAGAVAVLAHTLPEAGASAGVLLATGFGRDGWGDDPEAGPVWRWRRALPPA